MAPRAAPTRITRVADDLRKRIGAGEFTRQLPRVADLEAHYGVSTATVSSALGRLRNEGLITSRQGSGVYLRTRQPVRRWPGNDIELEWRRAQGGGPASGGFFEVATGIPPDDLDLHIEYAVVPTPGWVPDTAAADLGPQVLERTFWYTVAGLPHKVSRSYLPLPVAEAAGLTGPEVERRGMETMGWLARAGITVTESILTAGARMPTAEESEWLAIPAGTPVLDHGRTDLAGHRIVNVFRTVARGDDEELAFRVLLPPPGHEEEEAKG